MRESNPRLGRIRDGVCPFWVDEHGISLAPPARHPTESSNQPDRSAKRLWIRLKAGLQALILLVSVLALSGGLLHLWQFLSGDMPR